MEPFDAIVSDPAKQALFKTAEDKLVPDPIEYSTWFDAAPERKRMDAIGVRRYKTMADKLDRQPTYADYVDPETGSLAKVQVLAYETQEEHQARASLVQELFAKRREDIRQVKGMGFLWPE